MEVMNRDGLGQGPWPPFSIGIHEILQGATQLFIPSSVLRVTCRYTARLRERSG